MDVEDLKKYGVIIKGSLYEDFMSLSRKLDNTEMAKILGYVANNSQAAGNKVSAIRKTGKIRTSRLPRLLKEIGRQPSTLTREDIQFYLKYFNRPLPGNMFEELIECLEKEYNSGGSNDNKKNR